MAVLQPLDVSVFKSLKDHWGNVLFKQLKLPRIRLAKSEFLTVLPSKDVWKNPLQKTSKKKKGFCKCGILSYDCGMHPPKRLNVNLLKRYKVWAENRKPEATAKNLDKIIKEGQHSCSLTVYPLDKMLEKQ